MVVTLEDKVKHLQGVLKLEDEAMLEELIQEYGYEGCTDGLFIPVTKDFNISVDSDNDDVREYMNDEDATLEEVFDFYGLHEEEIDKHVLLENMGYIVKQIEEWLSWQEA